MNKKPKKEILFHGLRKDQILNWDAIHQFYKERREQRERGESWVPKPKDNVLNKFFYKYDGENCWVVSREFEWKDSSLQPVENGSFTVWYPLYLIKSNSFKKVFQHNEATLTIESLTVDHIIEIVLDVKVKSWN